MSKTQEKTIEECFYASPQKSIKWNTYFPVYDRLFSKFRGKDITFIEVGVLDGGSLFMWRDYFGPNARIIGLDLNPGAKQWEDHGFEIIIGDQADPEFWKSVFAQVGHIDALLDDGGHTFDQQIITLMSSCDWVKDSGVIAVEDTHSSYMRSFGGPSKYSFLSFVKREIDRLHARNQLLDRKESQLPVYSIECFDSIVAFHFDRAIASINCELVSNTPDEIRSSDFRYRSTDPKGRARPNPFARTVRKLRRQISNRARARKLFKRT